MSDRTQQWRRVVTPVFEAIDLVRMSMDAADELNDQQARALLWRQLQSLALLVDGLEDVRKKQLSIVKAHEIGT